MYDLHEVISFYFVKRSKTFILGYISYCKYVQINVFLTNTLSNLKNDDVHKHGKHFTYNYFKNLKTTVKDVVTIFRCNTSLCLESMLMFIIFRSKKVSSIKQTTE